MKRIVILISCLLVAFALTACAPKTLQDIAESDSSVAEEIDGAEQQLIASSFGVFSDVQVTFEGNTMVYTFVFTDAIDPAQAEAAGFEAELETTLATDASIKQAVADLAEGSGIDASEISVRAVYQNPDGTVLADVTV